MSTITLGQAIEGGDSTFNAAGATYRGFELEHTDEGYSYTFRFTGDRASMMAMISAHSINERHANYGRLKSSRMYQDAGPQWIAEFRYESHSGADGTTEPDDSYGAKSCTLTGGTLSNDLNIHPDYLTNWDHWLLAAKGTSAIPAWWSTATTTSIADADSGKYKWVRDDSSFDDLTWYILKQPTKPKVRYYDLATYSIVESAKFKTPTAAGQMVQGKLNTIGTPDTTFGITGGNWKCEHAEVRWTGKYWIASLTWTRSVDNDGWDTTLYGNGSGSSNNS